MVSAALGVKLFGYQFRSYLVGREDAHLFHFPTEDTLNNILRDETAVDDTTEPAIFIQDMIDLAKKVFGNDPLVLEHDERKVIYLTSVHDVQ